MRAASRNRLHQLDVPRSRQIGHRRSNFRQRVWLPTLAGDKEQAVGSDPTRDAFHDLRHTHKTWLIEDRVPQVLQHKRLRHKTHRASRVYSHVTRPMIEAMLTALQRRWELHGPWTWADGPRQGEPVG